MVLCLLSSLAACSEGPPEQPHRERTDSTSKAPTTVATTSGPAGRTVVESTMGGTVLYRDETSLRIEEAELLRSREGDEIFVRATIEVPAQSKDCFLMQGKTWFALRDAIESDDLSEAPEVLETFWADALSTEKLSSGDTYAVSFRQDPEKDAPNPTDTPFFVLCYAFADAAGDGPRDTTWYDVAHVEGTPEVP